MAENCHQKQYQTSKKTCDLLKRWQDYIDVNHSATIQLFLDISNFMETIYYFIVVKEKGQNEYRNVM